MAIRYTYALYQFGEKVAEVDASTDEDAQREINHYALIYSQDGPVEVCHTRKININITAGT